MKFLSSILSAIFNRSETVELTREQLAGIVTPFMPQGQPINDTVAKAFGETAEWVRIGFDAETDKGPLYHALHFSLRMVAATVRDADPLSPAIAIRREYIEALKASFVQLTEASRGLALLSEQKASYIPEIIEDRRGNKIRLPFTQIYNRPEANHRQMGQKLEEIHDNFAALFKTLDVREATPIEMIPYLPKKHY